MSPAEPVTGLILSGGGARAAYQVGVLAAIAELLPMGAANPFPVIVGTSAGAINAVSLASGAMDFRGAIERLTAFWQGFRSHLVLRSDWPGVIHQASRFVSHSLLGLGAHVPVALLNSSPLRGLLNDKLNMAGIAESIAHKQLQAVAVTAFGYESGQAVTFYQGGGTIDSWLRHRRIGIPTQLSVEHLLASSAIPLLFAPVKIGEEYFGDGAVRQSAPISPALAQIGGHMLNSTFIDSLESDIELLQRLNQFSHLMPAGTPTRALGVAPVEVLVISPSQPIDEIAARHRQELPAALRLFLRGPGATKTSGAGVLSYLLFEAGYCSELIDLGRRDALAKREELCRFLGLQEPVVTA